MHFLIFFSLHFVPGEPVLEQQDPSISWVLQGRLRGDLHVHPRVENGFCDEEVLGQVAAELFEAAGSLQDRFPYKEWHPNHAIDPKNGRHQVEARKTRSKVDLEKICWKKDEIDP